MGLEFLRSLDVLIVRWLSSRSILAAYRNQRRGELPVRKWRLLRAGLVSIRRKMSWVQLHRLLDQHRPPKKLPSLRADFMAKPSPSPSREIASSSKPSSQRRTPAVSSGKKSAARDGSTRNDVFSKFAGYFRNSSGSRPLLTPCFETQRQPLCRQAGRR